MCLNFYWIHLNLTYAFLCFLNLFFESLFCGSSICWYIVYNIFWKKIGNKPIGLFTVGPKSGGSSDTSPPLQSFAEESSPENLMGPSRMVNGQSTESLDSLSDESGNGVPGGHSHSSRSQRHNRSASGADLRNIRNPVPPPRQVWRKKSYFFEEIEYWYCN